MADDPVVVEGGRIDVSDVMARIRERIRAKRETAATRTRRSRS